MVMAQALDIVGIDVVKVQKTAVTAKTEPGPAQPAVFESVDWRKALRETLAAMRSSGSRELAAHPPAARNQAPLDR